MNPKPSGLIWAILAALALSFPLSALSHEGHGQPPGHTFENGSQPNDNRNNNNHNGGTLPDLGRAHNGEPANGGTGGAGGAGGAGGTAPIPEPETYAMMLAGLGVLVAAMRRRSRKADEAPKS